MAGRRTISLPKANGSSSSGPRPGKAKNSGRKVSMHKPKAVGGFKVNTTKH